ncbi:cellulose biosynthesis protein CelD [Streptomyces fumanus]|uniref:Cellulose biosynthesis protein CelD n=1 Tax=Streptomyces fumanus TaxID=67302 RepID=A0A919AWS5_9ACTN|nr:cellulose biosynthesis protein CelD [Streptomyces fumanus]
MSSGRTRVLRPEELGEEDREHWRELRAKSPSPRSPFMEPEFAVAVGRVRPAARVAVLQEDGETAGFLPFERGPLGQGRAIGLGVSDRQGAVLRQGPAPDVRALLRSCALSSFAFDTLEAEQTLFTPYAAEPHAAPVIDVAGGYPAYEEVLRARSPKFLKTTLAKERRLGRQVGDVRFVFDERDPAVLRTLMAWKSAQYRRTGRRDRFVRQWITRLLHGLAATRAPECAGTLSVLYAGGRPVAAHFGLRSATVLACWFPAYDPAYAKYSPGLVLHLRMAEAAAAAGIGLLDLGRGAAEYKDSLKTGELTVYEGAATRPGTGAVLHRLGREPVRRTHAFVRARPRLAAAAAGVLRGVGRVRRVGDSL